MSSAKIRSCNSCRHSKSLAPMDRCPEAGRVVTIGPRYCRHYAPVATLTVYEQLMHFKRRAKVLADATADARSLAMEYHGTAVEWEENAMFASGLLAEYQRKEIPDYCLH